MAVCTIAALCAACGESEGSGAVIRPGDPAPAAAAVAAPTPAAPASSAARGLELQTRLEFSTAREGDAKPSGLLAGDLDGDGQDELIAAAKGPGALEIWTGLSPGLAAAPEPRTIALGDFPIGPVWIAPLEPASKSPRALVAVASSETNELLAIDVRAAFRAGAAGVQPVWRRTLPGRPRVLASGDLGRDGSPELAVVTIEDDLYLFSGSEEPRKLRLCDELARCALLLSGGDGIAFGFQGSRRIVIYRPCAVSDENPVGLEPRESFELDGLPRDLDEVDLDGDGDGELAVAAGDHEVLVFGLGRGGGSTAWLDQEPARVRCGAMPIDLEHGDFDRDGRAELVAITLHSQGWAVIAWKGDALSVIASAYAGQRPLDGAIGDFDGDGRLDLAISNPDAKRASIAFATRAAANEAGADGTLLRSAEHVASERSPLALASGDLDADGFPEIVALAAKDGTLCVFRNDRGTLAAGTRQCLASDASALACGDLDGDGHVDAAFLQSVGKECSIVPVFGDGKGSLWQRAASPPIAVGASGSDLLLADLDGDGKVDAAIADDESDRVTVLRNETRTPGELAFGAPRSLEIPSGPRALVLVRPRVDGTGGTGGVAIAAALGGPGEKRGIAVLSPTASADGLSLAESRRHATPKHPTAIAAADLDGDGRQDLALLVTESGGDTDGSVIPLLQEPDGSWRALPAMPTGARPFRIAAADLDGDGRAEILVTAQNSHHVNLWLARPASAGSSDRVSFVRAPDLGAGTGPLDLEIVDLDRDGRPEIVVANAFSDELSVIRVW